MVWDWWNMVFPKAKQQGNSLQMVNLGDNIFKRKKKKHRETNGKNGHGLLHLSKAAFCGRH